jgi:Zn-dependent protease
VPPAESPLHSLAQFLNWSFRLGRFFGTEVRVYGAPILILLVAVLPLQMLEFIPLWERVLLAALGMLVLYATVWVHEMGHVLAGRRYGIRTPLITLSPLGGVAHLQGAAPNPRADIFISAAGPATHAIALAVVWPLSLLVGGEPLSWSVTGAGDALRFEAHPEFVPWTLARLVELNLALALFNLLPLYPLDGGRILRSLLAFRMHPNRATLIAARIGMGGAVLMVVVGLFGLLGLDQVGRGLLVMLGVTSWFACRRAVLEARYTDGPYGPAREPWEEDPDAWKQGSALDEEEPARRPRRRARSPEPFAPGEEELDRLLDRVKAVGLAGLSEAERAALLRASEARRAGR